MNLINIFTRYPDQEACIEHLENVRWGELPHCPHCGGLRVARKADTDRVGRWNCHDCKSSFNVLSGTIFEKTRVPLQKWFLAIGLIVNAKKSLSSYQLKRDLELNQKTAWYVQQRIRAAMATENAPLLQGIVETDETYIGGKPRKTNNKSNIKPSKRGRGTNKVAVIGSVERGGNVKARIADNLTGKGIVQFIKETVDTTGSLLITDEYKGYNALASLTPYRAVINHSVMYADGLTHTNTIEGFWSLLKRAWYGTHHNYAKQYMPLYIAEACWKYNHRKDQNGFGSFIHGCFK